VARLCQCYGVQRLEIFGSAVVLDDLVWGIVETKLSPLLITVERLLAAE
jgi:hypothetical protein